MHPLRRALLVLPLSAAGSGLWSLPSAAQGRGAEGGGAPLLRGVARMTCGTLPPRSYVPVNPGPRGRPSGSPQDNRVSMGSPALVGTLELSVGAEPRRGTAAAERAPVGSWSVTQLGHCTGGRGPLHLAVIAPAVDGHPARFEVRGPASHIERPGTRWGAPEGGEVRFTGTCGRRQPVVMEIWPAASVDVGRGRPAPERQLLIGTVTCAGAAPAPAPADTTPTATP